VDGVARSLEILDTAGQEEYSALRKDFMHKGDVRGGHGLCALALALALFSTDEMGGVSGWTGLHPCF